MRKIVTWLDDRLPWRQAWRKHVGEYPAPYNLNIWYVFGALALLVLVNQLITGIWLTMFYTPSVKHAFDSVEYIMRDVHDGWLFRYMHATGASLFFVVIYLHLFRGLLYGSYQKPRELVWLIGMGLFVLLMMEAFFGYLLPFGQMSYWGAQVITSLFSALPFGETLTTWIRGDYTVANATLQRFFAMHVIAVPLLILFLVYLHIIALHHVGSSSPDGVKTKTIPFHPFYTLKDSVAAILFLLLFFIIVCFFPTMGGFFLEADNFVKANAMVTPEHIAPAWYLTPFYSILRAIPNKLFGVIALFLSVFLLFLLPWLDKSLVKTMHEKQLVSRVMLGVWVVSVLVLGALAMVPVTPITLWTARIAAVAYFAYFLVMPFYTRWDKL